MKEPSLRVFSLESGDEVKKAGEACISQAQKARAMSFYIAMTRFLYKIIVCLSDIGVPKRGPQNNYGVIFWGEDMSDNVTRCRNVKFMERILWGN